MRRVYIASDYDGHNYIIPYDLKGQFNLLVREAYAKNDQNLYDKIETDFGKYATGGDINDEDVPLYAEI